MKELHNPDGNFLAAQWHALRGAVTRKGSRGFLTTGPDRTPNTGGKRFLVTSPKPNQHEGPRQVSSISGQAVNQEDSANQITFETVAGGPEYFDEAKVTEKDEWLKSKHLRFRQTVDPRSFAYREPRLRRGKSLFLEPVTTDNGRQTKIRTASSTPIYAGGFDSKAHIEATIGNHRVSLIRRTYSKEIIKTWKTFKDADLPVVPTMRRTIIGHQPFMLVTDVKADGSEVYGKGLDVVLRSSTLQRERPPSPEVDKHFLTITSPENIHLVEERARELTAHATKNGLRLPWDDAFELHVNKDGRWDLIILDLAEGCIDTEMPLPWSQENDIQPLVDRNNNSTELSLKSIKNVRKHLQLAA